MITFGLSTYYLVSINKMFSKYFLLLIFVSLSLRSHYDLSPLKCVGDKISCSVERFGLFLLDRSIGGCQSRVLVKDTVKVFVLVAVLSGVCGL